MNRLDMGDEILHELYHAKQIDARGIETPNIIGHITEKDKFRAAKQILLGLAILYVLTVLAYLVRPVEGIKLLDVCTTVFPPLATLILVFYFRERQH
jgi:hypothetical protein